MILFSGVPGQVAFLPSHNFAQGGVKLVGLPNAPITFNSQRSIITAVGLSDSVNLQMTKAIANEVYVYVFGDNPGELILSGISFAEDCESGGQSRHGVENIMRWYANNKISASGRPVRVMIGDFAFDGLSVKRSIDISDSTTRLVRWSLPLLTLPERLT